MSNPSDFEIKNGVLKKYVGPGGNVVIPEGVTSLGENCFRENQVSWEGYRPNHTLTSVTIPAGVEIIREGAFAGCSKLTSLIIPESVKEIHCGAFKNCEELVHLVIQGCPEVITGYDSSLISGSGGIKTAGPIGSKCQYEFAWREKIPEGALDQSLSKVILPEELKYLPGISNWDRVKFVCPKETFALLPNKCKAYNALLWLRGKMKLDATQEKTYNAYIKRARKNLFAALLKKDEAAAVKRLLDISAPNLQEIEAFLEAAKGKEHIEIFTVLLTYQQEHFSVGDHEKAEKEQAEKALGGKEYTLADWRKVFRLSEEGKGYEIQKYKLEDETVIIPELIAGKPVVSIGKKAFSDNAAIKTVSMPDTIFKIGESAFEGCTNLQSISLSKKVKDIEEKAFCRCTSLQRIHIPEYVKKIPRSAFYFCSNLIEVELPDTLELIEQEAFEQCSALRAILLPESVTEIGTAAFAYCGQLGELRLSAGLQRVENYTFSGCKRLDISEIPEGVTYIGCEAFKDCTSIRKIALPGTLETIRFGAFMGCAGLEAAALPSKLKTLEHSAFKNCTNLEAIEIPAGISKIAGSTLSGCPSLKKVVIRSAETELTDNAFGEINDSVRSIEINAPEQSKAEAFCAKKGLKLRPAESVTGDTYFSENPEKKTKRKTGAHDGDWKIEKRKNDKVGETCWITGYLGQETNITIPAQIDGIPVKRIGEAVFENNSSIQSVIVPEGIERIGYRAFRNCSSLAELIFPTTLQSLDNNMVIRGAPMGETPFEGSLWQNNQRDFVVAGKILVKYVGTDSSVVVPGGIEIIEEGAFYKNKTVKSVALPDSVAEIRRYAFDGCKNLEAITLPEGLSVLGEQAFSGCIKLRSFQFPQNASVGEGVLADCTGIKKVVFRELPTVMPSTFLGLNTEIVCSHQRKRDPSELRDTLANAEIGDSVLLGRYPQGEDGAYSDLSWRVLSKLDGRLLLLADVEIELSRYTSDLKPVTWEKCRIRKWLNNVFYAVAFDDEEKRIIQPSKIKNKANSRTGADGGPETEDKVFLLSEEEVKKYLPKANERKCSPSAQARQNNMEWEYTIMKDARWWLRTPADSGAFGICIKGNGSFMYAPQTPSWNICAYIRPALWLDIT